MSDVALMTKTDGEDVSEESDALRIRIPLDVRASDGEQSFGSPDSAELRLINKFAQDPLRVDEVFVFDAVVSNNSLDAYFTHMTKSSLRNYVKDAKAGVAVMNSHRTGGRFGLELPIGRSFAGEFISDGDYQAVKSSAYMRRGSMSNGYPLDSIIEDIRAGIIFDVSIGFRGGRWVCDSCGRDYMWECPHWAGLPDEDGNLVTVSVEDSNIGEYSLVYDGATPGAGIPRVIVPSSVVRKAERLAGDGLLSTDAIRQIEGQLHQRITPARTFPRVYVKDNTWELADDLTANGIDVDAQGRVIVKSADGLRSLYEGRVVTTPNERTDDMTGAELIAGVLANSGDTIPADVRTRLDGLAAQMTETNGTAEDAARALLTIAQDAATPVVDTTEVDALRTQVTTLEALAADGRAFRESLITEALADGVRAHGADFQRERYERLFREPSRSIEDIREFQAEFQKRAEQRLGPGGRSTLPLDPNNPIGLNVTPAETSQRDLSVYAAN